MCNGVQQILNPSSRVDFFFFCYNCSPSKRRVNSPAHKMRNIYWTQDPSLLQPQPDWAGLMSLLIALSFTSQPSFTSFCSTTFSCHSFLQSEPALPSLSSKKMPALSPFTSKIQHFHLKNPSTFPFHLGVPDNSCRKGRAGSGQREKGELEAKTLCNAAVKFCVGWWIVLAALVSWPSEICSWPGFMLELVGF